MRLIAALVPLLLGCLVQAEAWTIQTAAFQDYRQAASQVDALRELGFDAYSEFAMQGGKQFTRVRIGCFASRDAASSYARQLVGNVTAEAVAQPLTEASGPVACVEWDAGFVKPRVWELVRRGNDIAFRIEAGGRVAYLRHDGTEWEFTPELPAEPAMPPSPAVHFAQARAGALEVVQARLGDGTRINVCPGRLLWQSANVAVVERASTVIACVVAESEGMSAQ